jgi:AP-2 complex subunit alpha
MIEDRDPGVVMTAVTLVTTMAQDNLDAFQGCYKLVVDKLDKLIFDGDYPSEYVYYKVSSSSDGWKLTSRYPILGYRSRYYDCCSTTLLQVSCAIHVMVRSWRTDNAQVTDTIQGILQAIVDMSQDTPRNVQHNNAQNAVLFEAINLAIHLDPDSKVVSNASILLGRFILAKETNVRYLGLDAMAHLAACSNTLEPVKKHQETIILSLKDRDISVRRRALDLLYSMCDTSNSKVIVGELVKYLQSADYNLREEMVLKIAILTERFATEVRSHFFGCVIRS